MSDDTAPTAAARAEAADPADSAEGPTTERPTERPAQNPAQNPFQGPGAAPLSVDPADAAPVWRRAEPDSPCVRICQIHPGAGLCVGCLRTVDEITAWPRLSADARRALMAALPARAERLRAPEARPSRRRRT